MGAVMAVHGISSQMSYPGWREAADRQVVAGPGKDAFLKKRSKIEDTPLSAGPNGANYAGFSVLSYSKNQSTVMILMKRDGEYFSTSLAVEWDEGDWKLAPLPSGSLTSAFSRSSGADGFVLWETPDE